MQSWRFSGSLKIMFPDRLRTACPTAVLPGAVATHWHNIHSVPNRPDRSRKPSTLGDLDTTGITSAPVARLRALSRVCGVGVRVSLGALASDNSGYGPTVALGVTLAAAFLLRQVMALAWLSLVVHVGRRFSGAGGTAARRYRC